MNLVLYVTAVCVFVRPELRHVFDVCFVRRGREVVLKQSASSATLERVHRCTGVAHLHRTIRIHEAFAGLVAYLPIKVVLE